MSTYYITVESGTGLRLRLRPQFDSPDDAARFAGAIFEYVNSNLSNWQHATPVSDIILAEFWHFPGVQPSIDIRIDEESENERK